MVSAPLFSVLSVKCHADQKYRGWKYWLNRYQLFFFLNIGKWIAKKWVYCFQSVRWGYTWRTWEEGESEPPAKTINILAANQEEILSPHCCQFQFISGKCHLLILIIMHNSQEVSLWTWPWLVRELRLCQPYTEPTAYMTFGCTKALLSAPNGNAFLTHKEWERNRP